MIVLEAALICEDDVALEGPLLERVGDDGRIWFGWLAWPVDGGDEAAAGVLIDTTEEEEFL